MTNKSIYGRGGSGMTRGGLDRYLGPESQDYSNLPEHIEDVAPVSNARKVDCAGDEKDEAVCQIAAEEKRMQAEKGQQS